MGLPHRLIPGRRGAQGRATAGIALAAVVTLALSGCYGSSVDRQLEESLEYRIAGVQQEVWLDRESFLNDPDAAVAQLEFFWDIRTSSAAGRPSSDEPIALIDVTAAGNAVTLYLAFVDRAEATEFISHVQKTGVTCLTMTFDGQAEELRTAAASCAEVLQDRIGTYDLVPLDRLDVMTLADPSNMPPDPAQALPADAQDTVAAAIATGDADAITERLTQLFPQANAAIEVQEQDGEVAAAVSAAGAGDCIIMVRDRSGQVTQVGYDPEWIKPGELGCSPNLYFAPPH